MTTEDHKRKAILLQFFRIQSIEKKRIRVVFVYMVGTYYIIKVFTKFYISKII